MKKLSIEEAVRILENMKVKFPVPRAAETQIKRNAALEMAIKALATDINVGDKDTISRKAAIEALTKDKKALEHIINGMSGYEKEFDRFVGQVIRRRDLFAQLYPFRLVDGLAAERCDHFKTAERSFILPALDNKFTVRIHRCSIPSFCGDHTASAADMIFKVGKTFYV
jgi:hypothetical protein